MTFVSYPTPSCSRSGRCEIRLMSTALSRPVNDCLSLWVRLIPHRHRTKIPSGSEAYRLLPHFSVEGSRRSRSRFVAGPGGLSRRVRKKESVLQTPFLGWWSNPNRRECIRNVFGWKLRITNLQHGWFPQNTTIPLIPRNQRFPFPSDPSIHPSSLNAGDSRRRSSLTGENRKLKEV